MTGYQPFRKRNSLLLAAAIVLLALAASFFSPGNLFGLRSILISAIYPFQFAASAAWKGVVGFPSFIVDLRNQARENAELKARLNLTLSKLEVLDELRAENERLRQALGFRETNRYGFRLMAAKVIAKSGSILEVSRGATSGVQLDLPVLVKEGLVGKVIEVSQFGSKVLLVTDAMSSVAAVDQGSRDSGVVEGYSPNTLRMKYVGTDAGVREGDKIVTSPISSVFPAGIPIGTVSRVEKKEASLFCEVLVKPSVDFSKLEEVFLVR